MGAEGRAGQAVAMAVVTKSRQQFMVGAVAAAVITAALVLVLVQMGVLALLEDITYDARVRMTAKPETADKSIVIIDVDNASFNTLKSQFGRWPWSRNVWATVLYHVNLGHPRAVFFDAMYSGVESAEADQYFTQQLQYSRRTVLAFVFGEALGLEETDPSENRAKLQLLARDSYRLPPDAVAHPLEGSVALNTPLPQLATAAAGLGSANINDEGVMRRVALAFRLGDRGYPSLSARVADVVMNPGKAPQPFLREGRYARHGDWSIPIDDNGNLLLLWHGDSFVYERIPVWNVLCSVQGQEQQCDAQVKRYPPGYFRDKIVLIGASAVGSYEVRATPFTGTAPGFVLHATAVDNLLHHEGMRVMPRWFLPAAVIALAALGAGILVAIGSALWSSVLVLALLGAYAGGSYWSFGHQHLWVPIVAPALALVMSFASTGTIRFATTGRELRKTRGTLNRYMAPQLVDYVLSNIDNVQFAGEKRELTIFFSDVRNFTTLTEKSDPLVLIAMLNEYLTEMTDVIFKYDGVVDKFIGDGILAYWGAFAPGNHALQGARASLEMFERLKALNERWKEKGWPEIDIGVGLNTGEVIFGNVGAGKKIEFTVIGDPVNLASRLESENKPQKTHIIISEFTLAKLGDVAQVRPLGGVKVKGKTIETQIYELQGLRKESAAASASGGAS